MFGFVTCPNVDCVQSFGSISTFLFDSLWVSLCAMDPQCKSAVMTLMDSGKDHPLATWLQIEKVLMAHGMAYKAKVSPDAMLVHPGNRASLSLNPFEVHAKGAKLMSIGLDPAMLSKSTCIEVAGDAETRKKQFDFNKSDSQYLPMPGGKERFLSLSSSHTTAFMKAISAECFTPEPTLADQHGKLCLACIFVLRLRF